MGRTAIFSPVGPRAVETKTKLPFPDNATIWTENKDGEKKLCVAVAANDVTDPTPVESFTTDKIQTWIFCVNAMAANVNSASKLATLLDEEVQDMDKQEWKKNIELLSQTLQTAIAQSNKLCQDTSNRL